MRWFKVCGLLVVVISMALLSACSLKPVEPDRASQRAALERWGQCLERVSYRYQSSLSSRSQYTASFCEGHRRDVLATFPKHLENQVDTILSERTRVLTTRLVKTGLGNERLVEAHQDDL